MPVIETDQIIKNFIDESGRKGWGNDFVIQFKTIIFPLLTYFPQRSPAEVHHYLLDSGLFQPDGVESVNQWYEKMKHEKIYQNVKKRYIELKKQWEGPSVNIIILPIEQRNEMMMKSLGGKMGLGFQDKVILFLSRDISKREVGVLLTHEYNHACRLSFLNKSSHTLTLLDSILIEGLAENAVEQKYGKQFLGPWVELYSKKEALDYWRKIFLPFLSMRGKEKHHQYLYGSNKSDLPKWIGYSIGYHIVSSIIEFNPGLTVKQLLYTSSDKLLKWSKFPSATV
ncbi:DUF2268 domain-containing protein [Anaerobacillus sp. MEB173]|uniref:DUF2268 domain-containing protein n=1 Tax=Anaerobacillus sp. MEB173 TaxID=3383345 RepID=UPI003F8DBADA